MSRIQKAALVVFAFGVGLVAVAGYNMTLGENLSSSQQQYAAEVEPIKIDIESSASDLAIGQVFAKIRIPRFGNDYVRNIAEGTSVTKVLNTVGIGHYLGSQMPGEVGNFALAGHRAGNGGPMRLIDKFQAGDEVEVETASAKFTYRFIESKIVKPEDTGVISGVPVGLTGAKRSGKYLTLTTCTPIYVNTERYVAWFELVEN